VKYAVAPDRGTEVMITEQPVPPEIYKYVEKLIEMLEERFVEGGNLFRLTEVGKEPEDVETFGELSFLIPVEDEGDADECMGTTADQLDPDSGGPEGGV